MKLYDKRNLRILCSNIYPFEFFCTFSFLIVCMSDSPFRLVNQSRLSSQLTTFQRYKKNLLRFFCFRTSKKFNGKKMSNYNCKPVNSVFPMDLILNMYFLLFICSLHCKNQNELRKKVDYLISF